MEMEFINTFETQLHSSINLFTGTGFSALADDSTGGGYTDERLFS
ncbi:MAG: hypothetical protein PHC49_10340 [Desulfuromonadaceae bacterium]|nr:hypothetical protein [Desulfuromonadaceae bacterium]